MSERRAVMTVAAAALISVLAHSASAQSSRFDRGSENGSAEHGRDQTGPITERDRTDAQRALFRWDENKDGSIDRDEARRGHWSNDPFVFDANGDGRLTAPELAVRYARRRRDHHASPSGSNSRTPSPTSGADSRHQGDDDRATGSETSRSDSQTDSQSPNVHAYRSPEAYERLFGDLPTWFKERDADLDGQVMMSEYASEWTNELAEQFLRLDPNGDGVITSKECLNSRTIGSIASSALARMVAPASPPSSSSDTPDASDAAETSEAIVQMAENGTLPPAEAKAAARDARRQLWGNLYSSKRPDPPKDDR